MNSLTNVCLIYVADIADKLSITDIENLPVPILKDLTCYLSAFQLNRFHEVFVRAGISTHAVWSAHLTHRWTKSYQRAATLFRDDLIDVKASDPRQIYLERHFQWLLGHMATDSPRDLMRDIYVNLPKLRRQGPYVTMACRDPFTDLDADDLLVYAPFVRVLSVMATTIAMFDLILKNDRLLAVLRNCVRRLDLYFVNERNYEPSKELLTLLVRHGNLREFSLFSAQLPLQQLSDLLSVAAEQTTTVADLDNDQITLHLSNNKTFGGLSLPPTDLNVVPNSFQSCSDIPVVEIENSDCIVLDEDFSNVELTDVVDLEEFPSFDYDTTDANSNLPLLEYNCDSDTQEMDDLFDVAVLPRHNHSRPRAAKKSKFDIHKSTQFVSSHGCVSLTLAYLKRDYVVQEALSHVLPLWSSLKKLAILEVNLTDGQVFKEFLEEHIEDGQLSHLILHESDMCHNVLDVIVMSLLNKSSDIPMHEISLTFFDSQVRKLSDEVFFELQDHFFFGTVHLDLSNTCLSAEKVEFIPIWISHDLAMRHLYLTNFQNSSIIPDVLTAVLEMSKIETLWLEGISFSFEMESRLLSVLQRLKSLRSLNLEQCGLSNELVSSAEFIDSIVQHPNLTELNLGNNRLALQTYEGTKSSKYAGCVILRGVCSDRSLHSKFQYLDLSCNRIDGESLLRTAEDIYETFRKNRCREYRIFKLRIGGNIFGIHHSSIVQQCLNFSDIVIAEILDFNDANMMIDHVAQM